MSDDFLGAEGIGLEREELLRLILSEKVDPQAALELAEILLARGSLDEADRLARNVLVIAPRHPHPHRILGTIFLKAGRPEAAEYHFRQMLAIVGERPRVVTSLAQSLVMQGKLEEAETFFEKATALEPDNVEVLLGWCRLMEAQGHLPRAWELLERAERSGGETEDTRLIRAILQDREGNTAEAIETLSGPDPEGYGPPARALLERGRLFVKQERYEEGWADFTEAKRQLADVPGQWYDRERATSLVQRLAQFFTRQRMEIMPRPTLREDVAQPLFVLGFPRSGTTLVEQILTSHPLVTAGDELQFLDWVTLAAPRIIGSRFHYPEMLGELATGDNQLSSDLLADYYTGCARQAGLLRPGTRYFTDKMPLNETHLGLIHLLFPQSPIVYVRRHPLDVVCSNFATFHHHGFFQACDVDTSANHYLLIDALVTHYRTELDLRLLELRYEDLVASPETEIRKLLDFVGLEFDPACLAFHENPRVSRTGSYVQVTQEIYDKSIYRYRHFLPHLETAVEILRPVLERLGYPSD
jgi:tetratricopeptide (TPR) repeat protein